MHAYAGFPDKDFCSAPPYIGFFPVAQTLGAPDFIPVQNPVFPGFLDTPGNTGYCH